MSLKVYNGGDVSAVFNGIMLSGTADKAFVTIATNEDAYSLQVGVNGDACRSQSNNNSAKITISLGQWDANNALMSALHALDKLSGSGDGVGTLLVKDNSGYSLHVAETAWITKMPDAEYGREAGSRDWVLETNSLDVNMVGGN